MHEVCTAVPLSPSLTALRRLAHLVRVSLKLPGEKREPSALSDNLGF